jgi:FkbM family methyltransferase
VAGGRRGLVKWPRRCYAVPENRQDSIMLSVETKHRIADRFGAALGGLLRGTLRAATAVLPRNGREHVRRGALMSLGTAQTLRTVQLHGVHLHLEWGAAMGQPLNWAEPETFRWLESHVKDGDTVWDVGANIGLYTLWCAKRHPGCRVVAFEPNALTYPLLVRHVIANGVADRVTALPIALSGGEPSVETFRLSALTPGSTLNQLDLGDAPPMRQGCEAARYPVVAGSADRLIQLLNLPTPDHLKLDVDGIEPLILAGATEALTGVRSVLVEVEEEHDAGRGEAIERPLRAAGLVEELAFRGKGPGRNRLYRRGCP